MKKFAKLLIKLFTIIIIIYMFFVIKNIIEPVNVSLTKDREKINIIINKKYSSYEIKDLELEYTDWSASIRTVDNYHKATRATVIIENKNEQRTLYLKKNFFTIWEIFSDEPNFGPNVPNDIYFVQMEYENVGKAADIDEIIKEYWIIPDKEGNYYKKSGSDENWYYSFKHCSNIYKTKGGIVYIFNKEKSNWEISEESYSDLCFFGNYEKVDIEYAMEIIEKYSSLNED